mgnify:CR=1 FL=1|tara:strand:- start:5347 stop:5619 length:273 start_codon:yes stop_codon:yes gene_type:complete
MTETDYTHAVELVTKIRSLEKIHKLLESGTDGVERLSMSFVSKKTSIADLSFSLRNLVSSESQIINAATKAMRIEIERQLYYCREEFKRL